MINIGVNYGILGNRDFEFGLKALENHIQNSSTTWILSNVVDAKTQNQILNCERDVILSFYYYYYYCNYLFVNIYF